MRKRRFLTAAALFLCACGGAESPRRIETTTAPPAGPRTVDSMRETLRGLQPAQQACYQAYVSRAGSAHGEVVIESVIAADGRVRDARVGNATVGDAEMQACLLDAFQQLRFRADPGSTPLTYPVRFRGEHESLSGAVSRSSRPATGSQIAASGAVQNGTIRSGTVESGTVQSGPTQGGSESGAGSGTGDAFGLQGPPGEPEGQRDSRSVRRSISRNLPALEECYEDFLHRSDEGLHGRVVLRFIIAMDGSVYDARVDEGDMGDEALKQCIRQRIGSWRFGRANGFVRALFPFSLDLD